DAEAGDPRNLGNIGSQSHVRAFRQRLQHAFERSHPALACEAALMVAGAANGAYAQPFSGDRVDLAVTVTGDQYLHAVMTPKEWRHEMLTVPQGNDHGLLRLGTLIEICRLDDKAAGLPHQPQVLGGQNPNRDLYPAFAPQAPSQRHQRAPPGPRDIGAGPPVPARRPRSRLMKSAIRAFQAGSNRATPARSQLPLIFAGSGRFNRAPPHRDVNGDRESRS